MSPRKAPSRASSASQPTENRIVIDEEDLLTPAETAENSTSTAANNSATPESLATENPSNNAKKPKKSKKSKRNKAEKSGKKSKSPKKPRTKKQKIILGVLIGIVVLLAIALGVLVYFLLQKPAEKDIAREEFPDPIYSILTGEEISDEALNSSPTFCVQIPNGNDGGRPQAGLTHAGVVFEAIAEANITRFAAVFQNTETSAIGPVRSLRPYYLDWDTPFDCTIVHAGGSDEANRALQTGNYRDLNENPSYMWREEGSGRGWNNLFTSPAKISEFNSSKGYDTSTISAFPRYTPDEIDELLRSRETVETITDDVECTEESCDEEIETETDSYDSANAIKFNIGNISMFNVVYNYDAESNSYLRSYANGETHLVYDCPAGLIEPQTISACGNLVQVAPKAVVAMVVQEGKMADNYHENIKTLGSGDAYIFQNGEVIEGSWSKSATDSQIIFRNDNGDEIKFTPGQLWITAVPQYGTVTWE